MLVKLNIKKAFLLIFFVRTLLMLKLREREAGEKEASLRILFGFVTIPSNVVF